MALFTEERVDRAMKGTYWCVAMAFVGFGAAAVSVRLGILWLITVLYAVVGVAVMVGAALAAFVFVGRVVL